MLTFSSFDNSVLYSQIFCVLEIFLTLNNWLLTSETFMINFMLIVFFNWNLWRLKVQNIIFVLELQIFWFRNEVSTTFNFWIIVSIGILTDRKTLYTFKKKIENFIPNSNLGTPSELGSASVPSNDMLRKRKFLTFWWFNVTNTYYKRK